MKNLAIALSSLALVALAGCAETPVETVAEDPIHERFYAGGKADGLGIPAPIARTALLVVNTYDRDALVDVPLSYRTVARIVTFRAGADGVLDTADDVKIRTLQELDDIEYVGKGSMNALLDLVQNNNLVEDTTFWQRIQPAPYSDLSGSRIVFGGPAVDPDLKFNLNAQAGDRYHMRLSRTDGTGFNPRVDVWSYDDNRDWVHSPPYFKDAEFTRGSQINTLLTAEYRVALMNRSSGGLYKFEMECIEGPCLTLPARDEWAFLWEGELEGVQLDYREYRDWNGPTPDPDPVDPDPVDPDPVDPAPVDPDPVDPDPIDPVDPQAIHAQLRQSWSANYRWLSYRDARTHLFGTLHNVNGWVEGVYSGEMLQTTVIPDHTYMNTEHTWPKSRAKGAPLETDLHHLFPTRSHLNTARSNFFFCNVAVVHGSQAGTSWGLSPSGRLCFEPRDAHKGNAARAIFYIAASHGLAMDAEELEVLRGWNQLDPVDSAEEVRNAAIEGIQGNRNAFVDDASLVDLAF